VREGRFGPYVNLGKVNATLPKGMTVDEVTLEEGIRLIEEKGGPVKKKSAGKKAPAKKAPAKAAAKTVAKPKKRSSTATRRPSTTPSRSRRLLR